MTLISLWRCVVTTRPTRAVAYCRVTVLTLPLLDEVTNDDAATSHRSSPLRLVLQCVCVCVCLCVRNCRNAMLFELCFWTVVESRDPAVTVDLPENDAASRSSALCAQPAIKLLRLRFCFTLYSWTDSRATYTLYRRIGTFCYATKFSMGEKIIKRLKMVALSSQNVLAFHNAIGYIQCKLHRDEFETGRNLYVIHTSKP